MGRDLLRLLAQLPGDHGRGRTGDRSRPARVRAEPVRRVVRVALLHLDVLVGDAELVGDDLPERRLVALPLRLDAELEDRLPGWMHPELGRVEHAQARDVVVLAVPRADDFGEEGEADPEQPPLLARLGLL